MTAAVLLLLAAVAGSGNRSEQIQSLEPPNAIGLEFEKVSVVKKSGAVNEGPEVNQYSWALLEWSGNEAHAIHTRLYKQQLEGSGGDGVVAFTSETFTVDDGYVEYSCSVSAEETVRFPNDLKSARELCRELLSSVKDRDAGVYFFRKTAGADRAAAALGNCHVLGLVSGGSVWNAADKEDASSINTYRVSTGPMQYELRYNPAYQIFDQVKGRRVSNSPREGHAVGRQETRGRTADFPRMEVSTKLEDPEAGLFRYTSSTVIWQRNGTVREEYQETGTCRVLPEASIAFPFALRYPPSDGDSVVLMDTQQIKAEWSGGKIVRSFDGGVAEELASARFRSNGRKYWLLGPIGCLVILAVVLGLSVRGRFRTTGPVK